MVLLWHHCEKKKNFKNSSTADKSHINNSSRKPMKLNYKFSKNNHILG